MLGEPVSTLGSQVALVALPTQIFLLSHSAALVGLLGAFELGPMIVAWLVGGAVADRLDRRKVLIAAQLGVILDRVDARGRHASRRAPAGARDPRARRACLPAARRSTASRARRSSRASCRLDRLRSALAFNYGTYQLAGIVGPAIGGLLIAVLGIGAGYLIDAGELSRDGGRGDAAISPQPPAGAGRARIRRSGGRSARGCVSSDRTSGAGRQLRDRPRRDDVRLAAVDVRRAVADRLPRGHQRARACCSPRSRSAGPCRC